MVTKEKIRAEFDKLKNNKELVTYFVFVVLTFIFWYLNALSNQYTTNIEVDVRYVDFPEDQQIHSTTKGALTLNVSGDGITLARLQLRAFFKRYRLHMDALRKVESTDLQKLQYELPISSIRKQFDNKLGSGVTINSVFPEEVLFDVSALGTKKIAVKSTFEVLPAPQHVVVGEAKIAPDSVIVKGPLRILDTLSAIPTKQVVFEEQTKEVKRNVLLEKIDELSYNKKRVLVRYQIEKYIDAEISLPIRILNMPETNFVHVFPQKVLVEYRVNMGALGEIKPSDFEAVVDCRNLYYGDSKIEVELRKYPETIREIELNPRLVDFIIESKHD